MKSSRIGFLAAFVVLTAAAQAWNSPGHMAVAALAYGELTSAQRTRLVAILRQIPDMRLLSDGFPGGQMDDLQLVMAAATWPDQAKDDSSYQNNGYIEPAPLAQVRNDRKKHKGWHFIDKPLWLGPGPQELLPAIPKVNAVTVVNVLKRQLRSGESDAATAYDLVWLFHLVGDLHQPLHGVSGITHTLPKGDTGGNDVLVHGVDGVDNLHSLWDGVLGRARRRQPLVDDIPIANRILAAVASIPLFGDYNNTDPAKWAAESYEIARRDAYGPLTLRVSNTMSHGHRLLETRISDAYVKTAKRHARQRMRQAGHRLALILKNILGP